MAEDLFLLMPDGRLLDITQNTVLDGRAINYVGTVFREIVTKSHLSTINLLTEVR